MLTSIGSSHSCVSVHCLEIWMGARRHRLSSWRESVYDRPLMLKGYLRKVSPLREMRCCRSWHHWHQMLLLLQLLLLLLQLLRMLENHCLRRWTLCPSWTCTGCDIGLCGCHGTS